MAKQMVETKKAEKPRLILSGIYKLWVPPHQEWVLWCHPGHTEGKTMCGRGGDHCETVFYRAGFGTWLPRLTYGKVNYPCIYCYNCLTHGWLRYNLVFVDRIDHYGVTPHAPKINKKRQEIESALYYGKTFAAQKPRSKLGI